MFYNSCVCSVSFSSGVYCIVAGGICGELVEQRSLPLSTNEMKQLVWPTGGAGIVRRSIEKYPAIVADNQVTAVVGTHACWSRRWMDTLQRGRIYLDGLKWRYHHGGGGG